MVGTVEVDINFQLAEKVFGLYLFGAKEGDRVNLSMFDASSALAWEVEGRINRLERDEKLALRDALLIARA